PLAAQKAVAAAADIRLTIPAAIGIFGRRRPISRRTRRDRRERGRHQFFEPAVRRQRGLERLSKGRNFLGRKGEAEIRSEAIDLLQRRKADYHALPIFVFGTQQTSRQTRKATRGPKRPRIASMPALSVVALGQ